MQVNVTINGENQTFGAGQSLESLLATMDLAQGKVAVERNLEIVPRSLYRETMIEDGDRLEIVHFIGGG